MKTSVFITGIAGSGKSSIARELTRRGVEAFDIEDIPGMFAIYNKASGELNNHYNSASLDDIEQNTWLCNIKHLRRLIDSQKTAIAFYCGAADNWRELIPLFTHFIVLSVNNSTLLKRLESRKTGEYGATEEVKQYVLGRKNRLETDMIREGALLLESSGHIDDVADAVLKVIKP